MVHVKQFARCELYESTVADKHRWRGEWLNKDPEYWDQPWEVEAHGKELGLYVRYCEANKLGKPPNRELSPEKIDWRAEETLPKVSLLRDTL